MPLKRSLTANKITEILGIVNGTTNYMLTKMTTDGVDYETVLKEAQDLGYAEADPSTDIDGLDAAHKLTILVGLAFGHPVAFDSVYVEGIRHIAAQDHIFAQHLGYCIKLLGLARKTQNGLQAHVIPCLIPQYAPLAQVDGVFNAVSDYSNDSSNEIANAIQSITGSEPTGANQNEQRGP